MIVEWVIEGDFAHFSHPATIYSSLTYPVPPKTAVMGMVAAIAGIDEPARLVDMEVAVGIESLSGKRRFSFNGVKEALSVLDPKKWLECKSGIKERKQFYRELLVAPRYRIFCDLGALKERDRIVGAMERGRSYYPLYLGINLCLGSYELIEVHGRAESVEERRLEFDTMVPLDYPFLLEPGKQYTDVRMATRVDGERHFGGFRDYLVELGGKRITCEGERVRGVRIGERVVAWA